MFKVFSRSTKISSHKTKNNNKTILQMAFQKSEGKGGRGGGWSLNWKSGGMGGYNHWNPEGIVTK